MLTRNRSLTFMGDIDTLKGLVCAHGKDQASFFLDL